jgi:hypothetical protein
MSDLITVEVTDGIQIITINRPEAKNAINLETAQAMAAALDQLDSRDDIRIGILTGGGGTFSSGMDLKAFAKSGQRPYVEGRGFAGLNEKPPKKPLIAAVEGYALAGGCEMALASDLIVAASNAKFGLPEVKRGLVAGAGGQLRRPRRPPDRPATARPRRPAPAPRCCRSSRSCCRRSRSCSCRSSSGSPASSPASSPSCARSAWARSRSSSRSPRRSSGSRWARAS